MKRKNDELVVDFKKAIGKTSTVCDQCGDVISSSDKSESPKDPYDGYYGGNGGHITVSLRSDPSTVGGENWSENEQRHFDTEACLGEYMSARMKHYNQDYPTGQDDTGQAEADDEMDASVKQAKAKESSESRKKLKSSSFLYPQTKSYPVANCDDIRRAASAYGRGGNKDSFSTFKEKLTRKAKELGCESSLPSTYNDSTKS